MTEALAPTLIDVPRVGLASREELDAWAEGRGLGERHEDGQTLLVDGEGVAQAGWFGAVAQRIGTEPETGDPKDFGPAPEWGWWVAGEPTA